MKKSDEIALTAAHLSCDDPPEGHHEHCQLVWKAFRLGRDFEKAKLIEESGDRVEMLSKVFGDIIAAAHRTCSLGDILELAANAREEVKKWR